MRILILISAVGLIAASVLLLAAKERPRCENCGMFEDVSPTRVVASFKVEDKAVDHHFVCIQCIREYNDEHYGGKAELVGLKILDYSTFGTKSEKMIDGMKAFYLYGTADLDGSMAPYIAAFASKDAAVKAQKTIGGELLEFKPMWSKLLSSSTEESEDAHQHGHEASVSYVCEMCNYASDEPGNCPHCGMKLKKVETEE